ncbi:copper transport protein [Marmoricola sp. URHA0025 HA25]
MTRLARRATLLGIAVVVVPLTLLAGPAAAHNELVKATPADGTTFAHLPDQGRMQFEETLVPSDLTIEVGGSKLPVSPVPGDPNAVTFDLGSLKPARTLLVTWTVVDSHDGHRSGGSLRWHVEESAASASESAETVAPADARPRLLRPLELTSKIAGYLAMALLVGGLLFLALLWPEGAVTRRVRTVLGGTVVTGLLASAGGVGVVLWRGADQAVADTLATDYGRAATSMVLVWLFAAVVVAAVLQLDRAAVRGIAWRISAVLVSAGLVRIAGMNAHATQGNGRVLGIAADFLHLTAVSAWVGGLVMLSVCLLPRGELDEIEAVVPKFSRVAQISVLMIVSSGLLLLWDISRGIDGFWATHYAHVLVLKLSLFSLVMLAAMKSKRWVQTSLAEAVAAHRRTAVRSFAVSVAAETALVLAVLSAASVLVTSSPGA